MEGELKKNRPLMMILAVALLFGLAVGYNQLRIRHLLAEKKVFPQDVPELKEHHQFQGNLSLETVKFDQSPEAVLGTADQKVLADLRLKVVDASAVPGLGAAAKKFFAEKGLTSITIAHTAKTIDTPALIEFAPEKGEQAELVHYLIGQDLEVEMKEIEEEELAQPDFDITLTLATASAQFEPYF